MSCFPNVTTCSIGRIKAKYTNEVILYYRVIVLIVTQEDDFYDPSEGSNQLIKPTGGTYRPGGRHL